MTEPQTRRKVLRATETRLRRFLMRHLPLSVGGLTVLVIVAAACAYFYASSATFENIVRGRLIASIEDLTGGRAEIGSFHWRLIDLEADVGGVTIHGLEAPGEAPYAQVAHLRGRMSILGFFSPRLLLTDLEVTEPRVHIIVYPGGETNQPHPRRKPKAKEPPIDRLFDLEAGRISVAGGMLDYDNRAAAFDFQNRRLPLDFEANDVSLRMSYVAAAGKTPEIYRIEAGATDLILARAIPRSKTPPVQGLLKATLDLTHNAVYLRSLRLAAHSQKGKDHSFDVSGSLDDFSHPVWSAKLDGELDMRLLESITGYPFAPEGIARLGLVAGGQAAEFKIDGNVHIDGGAYIGPGVVERGVVLDAHVHADAARLLIGSVVARLPQGGRVEGVVDLAHWLPTAAPSDPAAMLHAARFSIARHSVNEPKPRGVRALSPDVIQIPVDGKVTAEFKDVSLDTILDIVGQRPFQRIGIDTQVNGTALANWVKGDQNTLVVNAALGLSAPARPPAAGSARSQEAPATGAIDATYEQRHGSVEVRKLELHLPSSEIAAHGQLGAYPLTSPTALSVHFHSGNFAEFDSILRDLGLQRNGRAGAAALPVSLRGQADFDGTWAGSLLSPRLAGHLNATGLNIEMPPAPDQIPLSQPRYVRVDSFEADGSYSSERVAFLHAMAQRDKSKIVFAGKLDGSGGNGPSFDLDSVMHLRAQVSKVGVADIQPFLSRSLQATGTIDAEIQADGPLRAPSGSGWAELDGGSICGEPVARLRAQGLLSNQVLKLSSMTLSAESGAITAALSYDLRDKSFEARASGTGIDISRIHALRSRNLEAAGRLTANITGSGTLDSPRIESHATLTGFALGGEPLGGLEFQAHTASQQLNYEMASHLEGAEVHLHGQIALQGDYATQAEMSFEHFDIGALLRLAHVQAISGQSSLAGTVTVAGSLEHPAQMRGEARLQELAVTLSGVRIESEGSVHATLADGRIHLDPLHVTGDNTDMHAQGSLSLLDAQQLDLAASGSINLKLAETLDSDLTSSGISTFQVEAHGPLANPAFQGRIDFENGSLSLEDLPNGLSQLHGTLAFTQNRLEVKTLTAMSGGGLLSVTGSLAYQHGIYANLEATGKGIRIRYPQGVSSLADATLRLEGSQSNLLLSGNVLITRFTASADLDLAALAAQANSVQAVVPVGAPSNHVRLDVHVLSSPQLNFQNAFAKLAGDVDLRLRGTIASPSLLGRVSITEGNAMIAGTHYELQRGEVSFTNPVRIEPVIDLTATAHAEDYDVTLGLHGIPSKLAVTYRSDPPLPEADVVSLLALGHTESQQRLYTQQQEQALANPTTDALLGGALNASVSSRVQKLFGAGSVKVDPNYLGAFGNSTSRITVEEQLGRNVTLTYATDVNTTGQQLLQAEVAINRHVSLVVARDESGVFSMVVKATRRYR